MALFKKNELKQFGLEEIDRRLEDLRKEALALYAKKSTGGALENPGKIKLVKKTIARLLTLKTEKINNTTDKKEAEKKQKIPVAGGNAKKS